MDKLAAVCLVVLAAGWCQALNNGLARTPPMGWLSWERYRCNLDCKNQPDECISEKLYMDMADRMASEGYKEAGYEYVNIDDCWPKKQRDANGSLVPDPERFPSGIKALADYVHAKGLKLGIYSDMGSETCGGYPGSKFYMEQDAQTFADWGIDSLKLDGCYSTIDDFPIGYPIMGQMLNKTGRPILYSCSWPAYYTGQKKTPQYKQIAESCNLWRNYDDIDDSFESVTHIIDWFADDNGNLSTFAKPGAWNDPDMIVVGGFGLSYDQQRVQMAVWAMMAAPLYMSNDLRNIKPESKALLLNKRIIAINQDPLGIQGIRVFKNGDLEFWRRPISPAGSFAVAVVNYIRGGGPTFMLLQLSNFGVTAAKSYKVTEAFDGFALGTFGPDENIGIQVNPSGVVMAVATPA